MLSTLRIAFKALFILGFIESQKIFQAVVFDFVSKDLKIAVTWVTN